MLRLVSPQTAHAHIVVRFNTRGPASSTRALARVGGGGANDVVVGQVILEGIVRVPRGLGPQQEPTRETHRRPYRLSRVHKGENNNVAINIYKTLYKPVANVEAVKLQQILS